jgi:hypothetical protein
VNLPLPRLRLTRTGIFVLLAVLVVCLGAAAKHSQFDGPPHRGYLSKAVKMAGVRVDDNNFSLSPAVTTPDAAILLLATKQPLPVPQPSIDVPVLAVLSPPLRV